MSLAVKAARLQSAGDPGLFGSIGKFIGGAAKIVGGILPGPLGIPLKLGGGLLSRLAGGGAPQIAPRAPQTFQQRIAAQQFFPVPGVGGAAVPVSAITPAGIACPSGMHANKSAYFLKSGQFVGKGTRCVPSRRRNPGNSRANDRAIGRIESAKKMAARLGRITIRKECPGK
jgi:hypothetical protein